jgi:hypothetical protein
MPATYIMRNDPHAKAAYQALRKRGLSRAKAEQLIERVFYQSFVEVLLDDRPNWRDADRRPEIWFLLAEGMPVKRIFPDLPERHSHN